MLDSTIKGRALQVNVVYALNDPTERFFFCLIRRIKLFLTSRRLVFAGDWNAVVDSDMDRI